MEEKMNDIVDIGNMSVVQKLNKGSLVVKGVGALAVIGGVGLLLPTLVNAFLGGMTLLGIGAVVLVGLAMSKFVVFFGQKLDNQIMGLRKKEARENPIEQLQNELISSQRIFDARKIALSDFHSEIKNTEDDLKKSKDEFPNEDWSSDEITLSEAKAQYKEKEIELGEAEGALLAFAGQIKVRERRLKMAMSTEKLTAKTKSSKEEVVSKILIDEAFDAVRDRLNSAMSAIQVEASLRKSRQERTEKNSKKSAEVKN